MAPPKGEPTQSVRYGEPLELRYVRLVVHPDTPHAREVPIGDAPMTIGKDPACDVYLEDPTVSRQHARVQVTPQGVQLEDLGSRNGTIVNGTPIKLAMLTQGARITVGQTQLRLETGEPEEAPEVFGDAVGGSSPMKQVFALLRKIAPSDITVTLLGETGVGKDVLARAIHSHSGRKRGPFEVFDCGAVAANLIESSLFGHQKGAFTGAVSDRHGAFELAHGGTLFLDEVGELPLELQPRLLRVLEEQSVRRVGGADQIPVDVRVVAATNRDLQVEVQEGRFRQDLYFRLNAAVVHIPPLRERIDDLPRLVDAILAQGEKPLGVSEATLAALRSYDWPGNVRELKNVIGSAAAFADSHTLEPRNLMFYKGGARERAPTLDRMPLAGRTLEAVERAAIKQTLDQTGGNKSKAARALGIASSTLYEKIKKYGL